jgi:hypothetical protein
MLKSVRVAKMDAQLFCIKTRQKAQTVLGIGEHFQRRVDAK